VPARDPEERRGKATVERDDPASQGQSGCNPFMLAIYDPWVLGITTRAIWKTPTADGRGAHLQPPE
jgi:hypothetical protein